MRYVDFKDRAYKNHDTWCILPKLGKDITLLDKAEQLKAETGKLNFKCDFDENTGICKYSWRQTPMCCCRGCAARIGYLECIKDENDFRYYAKLFSPVHGFWRKDRGCVLDRNKRSTVCTTYVCEAKVLSKKEYKIIEDIEEKLQKLYTKISNMDY